MTEIITRAEAKARGLKRYFTGKSCKWGHRVERYVATQHCTECIKERNKRINQTEEARQTKRKSWLRMKRKTDPKYSPWRTTLLIGEAIARGQKRYFTGKPCKRGHICERYVLRRMCVECVRLHRLHAAENLRRDPGLRYRKSILHKRWSEKNKGEISKKRKEKYRKDNAYRLQCLRRANEHRIYGPKNPKGEAQWLRKNKALLRGLRRILRHPNRDHSSWLNEVQKR